jgi:hypothetical protein
MTGVIQFGHSGWKRNRALIARLNPSISSNLDQFLEIPPVFAALNHQPRYLNRFIMTYYELL